MKPIDRKALRNGKGGRLRDTLIDQLPDGTWFAKVAGRRYHLKRNRRPDMSRPIDNRQPYGRATGADDL